MTRITLLNKALFQFETVELISCYFTIIKILTRFNTFVSHISLDKRINKPLIKQIKAE